jgi:WD40 repeat protein/predicted Ser/Thr protein kinase
VREAAGSAENLLGDFVLIQPVGMGAAGTVYRSWQRSLRRYVAVKVWHDPDPAEAGRFAREAQIAARLSHPHIVPVYEVGSHEGRHYLTMKLIGGVSMSQVSLQSGPAATVMRDAADALDHAHRAGIVHRDLKPHNLLLEDGGHVWITDFGLAQWKEKSATLTGDRRVVGTPAYMPPEQAKGQRCDERSDIYALGATFYQVVAGRAPYEGDTAVAVLLQQLASDPPPLRKLNPRIHPELETIIAKAMAGDPARRYPTARALADDLRRHLAGAPVLARPPAPPTRALKWARRHPLASAALAGLAFLSTVVVFYLQNITRARRRTEVQLVETMVAEANALGAAGHWEQARARYLQASGELRRLGVSSAATDLGLLDAYHHAPPPLLVLRGHAGAVRAVEFLPDGKQALSASDDGTVRLWDLPLGRAMRTFRGHSAEVTCLALSADGRLVLTGSGDESLRLWDVSSGRSLRSIGTRGGAVLKVALSPDGRLALSRTAAGVVQLWDLATGEERRAFNVTADRIRAVAFSPDGKLALTGRELPSGFRTRSTLSAWDVQTGQVVRTVGGFRLETEVVRFSPDGRRVLAAGFDQLVTVWDFASGRRLLLLRGHLHGISGAAFSQRDRVIASGGQDNTIRLWDADSGQPLRVLDAGHRVEGLSVSPDGKLILSAGADGTLKLWDVGVGQEVRSFSGHEGPVYGVTLSPDGRLGLSGGRDEKLRLWDMASGREVRSLRGHRSGLFAVAFTPDGRGALSGGVDGVITLWDLRAGTKLGTLVGHTGIVRSATFSPDGRLVLSGTQNGEVKVWDVASRRELQSWRHGLDVRSVIFSPDGRLAMSGSTDGAARLWDVEGGRQVGALAITPPEHVTAVAMSSDGRLALTGTMAKTIRLWDVPGRRLLRTFEGHVGDIRAVRLSPDDTLVLSLSRDRTLRAWDRESGRELHAFSWAGDRPWSFALGGDGRLALAGNEDGSMSVWDFAYPGRYHELETRTAAALGTLGHSPDDPAALATLGGWYAFRNVPGWAIDLLARAERGGAVISPLVLARMCWQEGDLVCARRELQRALARGEAPPEYLTFVLDQIGRSDQEGPLIQLSIRDGRVRYPFLGIRSTTAEEPDARGARITRVLPGSVAARAGLRVADVIVRVDEQKIESDGDLGSCLAARSAGGVVTLATIRQGQSGSVRVTLGERPARHWDAASDMLFEPLTGWTLQTVNPEVAASLGLDRSLRGAAIVDIGTEPPLETVALVFSDDVLVRVAGTPVRTAEEAAAAIAALPNPRGPEIDVVHPGTLR